MDYIWNQSSHQVRFEKLDIDRKAGLILCLSLIGISSALVYLIYWKSSHGSSYGNRVLEIGMVESFHGVVDSIYNDQANHNEEVLRLSSHIAFRPYRYWEDSIAFGDTLYKKFGQPLIKVHKKDGSIKILDFRKLAKQLDSR